MRRNRLGPVRTLLAKSLALAALLAGLAVREPSAAAQSGSPTSPSVEVPASEAVAAPRVQPGTPVDTALEGLEVRATAAPARVEVGEPIEVVLIARGEGAASLVLMLALGDAPAAGPVAGDGAASRGPATAESSVMLGDFDVLRASKPLRGVDGTCEVRLTLATYETGIVALPALPVSWTVQGARREGKVELGSVEVTSLVGAEADPSQFRDIRGEVDLPRLIRWGIWAAIAAAALAMAALALWLVFRPRTVVVPAPHEWAQAEFLRIEREGRSARGEFGPYYDDLTRVVRAYVARRFAIPADRQTSRELLADAATHADFPSGETNRLRDLLRLADLVKFASAQPTRGECDAHLAEARAFVDATRPVAEARGSAPTKGDAA